MALSTGVPRVSVVIITYNQEDLVAETLASVVGQDWPNLEIIVSDDGSADGTVDVVRDIAADDPRITLVAAPKNQGITANCNQGYAAVTGEFLVFLGGDDLMLPGRIRDQVQELIDDPAAAACISTATAFHEHTGETLRTLDPIRRFGRDRFTVHDILASANTLTVASAWMLRRSMAPSRFEPKLPIASDVFFFIETCRAGHIVALPQETTRYRVCAGSATARGFGDDPYVMRGLVEARFPELIDSVRRSRAVLFGFEGTNRMFRGDASTARRFLWESLRLQPLQGRVLAGLAVLTLPTGLRDRAIDHLKRYRARA